MSLTKKHVAEWLEYEESNLEIMDGKPKIISTKSQIPDREKELRDLLKKIEVAVDYYDDEEKKKLLTYSSASGIAVVAGKSIYIPIEEFLTYYLFHRKRPGKEGHRNYKELGKKIGTAIKDLEDWIDSNERSIFVPSDVGRQLRYITEYVGESIGLAVINRIHNLTEADWDRIPEHGGPRGFPTPDYQVASDGKTIIQLEAKGSVVNDNSLKESAVSNQKSRIHRKKEKIVVKEESGTYRYLSNLRYGTISVLDYNKESTAKCWLVDPDPDELDVPPGKLRLINRLKFFRDWISFISPRSQLATALSTRIGDIEALSNPNELNGVALRRSNGEKLFIERPDPRGYGGSSFYQNKSRVTDGPARGIIVYMENNSFFFLGLMDEIPEIVTDQDFERIVTYSRQSGTVSKTVECVISESRFEKMRLSEDVIEQAEKTGGYYRFELFGELRYAKEGIVYGILPTTEGSRGKNT